MRNILYKIHRNRYFLLFILLFAYVQTIYRRISIQGQIDAYIFTPEAALAQLFWAGILFLIILFFLKKWQPSASFHTKSIFKIFGASLIASILLMQASGLLIAFSFGTIERNFNKQTLVLSLFSDFLNGLIYGSFFLAYYYYRLNQRNQKQLVKYNEALAESKINQLKAQLNPHFLFNNLNVLDQLIEEDKYQASQFLNDFAEIYRYVLQASDKETVHISEELEFAKQYFKLFQHKYGEAYQLNIERKNSDSFIVPLTLQLLIENAIQHNLGTVKSPICIKIAIEEALVVSNNTNLKRNNKTTSGRALRNLKEQYKLLTNKPMEIDQSNTIFSVAIPLIYTTKK